MTDANKATPQQLFERAARLIEQALIQLDTKAVDCATCGHLLTHNVEQARIYQQFTDTPSKLRTAVNILDGSVLSDGHARITSKGYWKSPLPPAPKLEQRPDRNAENRAAADDAAIDRAVGGHK